MIKKYLFLLLTGCLAFTYSCVDFLDVTPPSGFTEKYVFSSETEIQAAIASIYSGMLKTENYGNRMLLAYNTNTDVEMAGITTDAVSVNGGDVACFDPKPYWTTLNDTWNGMYDIINRANDVLQGIEGSDLYANADKTAPSAITQMYGEVKVLRAMVYLDIIRLWGDVVFRTKPPVADEDMIVGVTDRFEIMEYLIDDLIAAEPLMMYAAELDYGVERASREYCQSMIGQLALNRGGWILRPDKMNTASIGYMERGENFEYYYGIAIEYLGKVINEGRHNLNMSYDEFWIEQCNWNTAVDDDVIFAIAMLRGSSGEFAFQIGTPITNGSHPYGRTSGNVNLCGTYIYSFDNADTRRDVTCTPFTYNADLKQEIRMEIARVPVGKWSKLKMRTPLGASSEGNTGINYIKMRFADVLLMYAEAVNELYGPRDDAKEALARVRRRAFPSEVHGEKVDGYINDLGTEEEFFKAIMDERKWEFGGEFSRKHDLARWNKYGEVIYNLYNELIAWGQVANGSYNPDVPDVPASVYWKEIPDPENPGRIILDIIGIDRIVHALPVGYTEKAFAKDWWALDNNTESFQPNTTIKWSFRGFINYNNASSVLPTDPLRYLCPYPTKVITDHRGEISNYYGF